MRSSPGRRPRVIEMTNSASSLPLASSLSSRPSCERHVRHVVSLSSAETSVTVASGCGLFPQASSPVSVAAWAAPYRPLLALTTLTKPAIVGMCGGWISEHGRFLHWARSPRDARRTDCALQDAPHCEDAVTTRKDQRRTPQDVSGNGEPPAASSASSVGQSPRYLAALSIADR